MPQQRITYCGGLPVLVVYARRAATDYILSGSSGGGGGGGGGGAGGADDGVGGGIGAFPGVGIGGSSGVPVSTCTQDDRSKNMNSSAFSCAVSVSGAVQPIGNGVSGWELSPEPSETWTSVNTTRPH